MKGGFFLSNNPVNKKTKRYTKKNEEKIITIDVAREFVIKIKKMQGLAINTIANYEKVFNDFDRFYGEKADITKLSIQDARDFIYWQLHEKKQFLNQPTYKVKKIGLSPSGVNTYLMYAKAIFTILCEEKIVDKNIFLAIAPIKEQQKRIETLTVYEINKILNELNKEMYSEFREYVILNTLLDSFGRITEVLSLKKTDINHENFSVTFQNTKNKKARIVPVTKKTIKLLTEMMEENEEIKSDYIFLTNHGKPLTSTPFRKHLAQMVDRAGIKRRVPPHLFRHTASEMFLRQGGSMRVLQQILGHSDLTVTLRYAHVLDTTIVSQHGQYSPLNLIEQKEKRKRKRNMGRDD